MCIQRDVIFLTHNTVLVQRVIVNPGECLYFLKIITLKYSLKLIPSLWTQSFHSCHFLKQFWKFSFLSVFRGSVVAVSIFCIDLKCLPFMITLAVRRISFLVTELVAKVDEDRPSWLMSLLFHWVALTTFLTVLSKDTHRRVFPELLRRSVRVMGWVCLKWGRVF